MVYMVSVTKEQTSKGFIYGNVFPPALSYNALLPMLGNNIKWTISQRYGLQHRQTLTLREVVGQSSEKPLDTFHFAR
eukprot:6462683-Amphidinium_carterae.1